MEKNWVGLLFSKRVNSPKMGPSPSPGIMILEPVMEPYPEYCSTYFIV